MWSCHDEQLQTGVWALTTGLQSAEFVSRADGHLRLVSFHSRGLHDMSLNVALCGKDKFGLADVRSSLNAMCISCILACEFFACSLLIVNVQRFPRLSQ